jgi:hypothetical protein
MRREARRPRFGVARARVRATLCREVDRYRLARDVDRHNASSEACVTSLPAFRACDGKTRDGSPCRNPVGENGRQCRQHDPKTAALARVDSARGVEVRKRPITEAIERRVARDPDAVIAPMWDALEATKSYVTNGELVTVPDHATRIKASEAIADRLEGKAAQRTEITGAGGGPLELLTLLAATSIETSF